MCLCGNKQEEESFLVVIIKIRVKLISSSSSQPASKQSAQSAE